MTNHRANFFAALFFAIFYASSNYLAYFFQNPHVVNRMGALLAAGGALLLVIQLNIEESSKKGDDEDNDFSKQTNLDLLTSDLAKRVSLKRSALRSKRRRAFISFLAMLMFVAEIMHGWGDFLYEQILVISRSDESDQSHKDLSIWPENPCPGKKQPSVFERKIGAPTSPRPPSVKPRRDAREGDQAARA